MISEKIQAFLNDNPNLPTPFLVVDLDLVKHNFNELKTKFDEAEIFYAVKANPATPILEMLRDGGSSFDVASIEEIDMCLDIGISADKLSFGNTIKKAKNIKNAYDKGIRIFAFDSIEELHKLAENAKGSKVFCRVLVENNDALWPLSKKFGCSYNMAIELLAKAKELGLIPWGISFHVGSQQISVTAWQKAFAKSYFIYKKLKKMGIQLEVINTGGGFPAFNYYKLKTPALEDYINKIRFYKNKYFKNEPVRLLTEPGRYMAADAGVIKSEVVLVSTKAKNYKRKWVYLDIGVFGGLIETLGESIPYQIVAENKSDPLELVYLAGPTCDSMDIMYQKAGYYLPSSLTSGDTVLILSTGAYTTTYSAVKFNGFPPLKDYYV
ncbi:type III PLP-dependent enzyme [Rickettsiales bacterium LUAb2]